MSALNIRARWNEAKGKLKLRYSTLTEDDLVFAIGKEGELIGRLQQRLGVKKNEVFKILSEL
jgi:uncharacterized protein YjbJ (UPF0337 family)